MGAAAPFGVSALFVAWSFACMRQIFWREGDCRGRNKRVPLKARFGGACLSRPLGGARLSCPPKRNGLYNVAHWTRQAGPSEGGSRRGMPVMPAEVRWMIKRIRRGTLVVPAEVKWIIQYSATDLTSRSLREEIRREAFVRLTTTVPVPVFGYAR